jgi:sodium/proline symporter
VLLGLVGTAYSTGVSTFWLLPGALIGYISTWALVGGRFRDLSQAANTTSTPQTLAAPYPEYRRWIVLSSGSIVLVFMSVYVAAQFNSSGKAFQSVLHVPYMVGVWLSLLFVLGYSIVGGTRSVSWTNVIQASMMAFALIVMPVTVLLRGGLFTRLFSVLAVQDRNLVSVFAGKSGWDAASLVAGWVFIGIAVPGMPHVLRRFIASRQDRGQIRRGGLVSVVWSQTIFIGAITLGLAARAFRPGLPDPEKTLPLLSVELLPAVMAGFMLAAVWAAMSSTADSQMVEAVSAITEDFGSVFKGRRTGGVGNQGTSGERVKPLRAWVVTVGAGAAIMASTEDRNIFTLELDAWNVLGASLAPPILFTLLVPGTSGVGVVLGILGGAGTVFVWRYVIHVAWLSPLVPGFVASCMLILLGSKLFPDKAVGGHDAPGQRRDGFAVVSGNVADRPLREDVSPVAEGQERGSYGHIAPPFPT